MAGSPNCSLLSFTGQKLRALIDTGAEVSLMKRSTYESLRNKGWLQKKRVNLQSVSGNLLTVHGYAEIPFKIGGVRMTHGFYIVKDMNRSVIMGRDWMKNYGVRIYFDLKKLRVKGTFVDLEEDIHIASLLRLKRSVVLKPHTVSMVHAGLKNTTYFEKGQIFQIAPSTKGVLSREEGIVLGDAIVKMSKNRQVPLMIANNTNKTMHISRGRVVGLVERIPEENIVDFELKHEKDQQFSDKLEANLTCPPEHKDRIERLVKKNNDIFAFSDAELTETPTLSMDIDTGDSPPVRMRAYRTPLKNREIVEKAVNEMLQANIIKRSQSEWSSPIVIVGKKDGSMRFCCDYRALNAITRPISYPLPIIDDLLAQLDKARYISTLDLKSGYWAVPLTEEAKAKSSFVCHLGAFSWNRMPFGLRNCSAVFVSLIDEVLKGMSAFSSAYIDDILVFSPTLEEHEKHLQDVFDRLREHRLKLKMKKCSFLQPETQYLGFIITKDGIKPDPEKVAAIKQMQSPRNLKESRSIIGFLSFYRRFLPNYSAISEPIVALTRKYAKFVWTKDCETAFQFLKDSLAVVPMLSHPDVNKEYILYTDASDIAIGAALVQEGDDGEEVIEGVKNEKPIYFISHKLSRSQRKWSTIEKEAYSIHYALQKLDFFLHNSKFTIRTDHMPLRQLLSSPMQNRKVQTWALNISGYNCSIEYIKGRDNTCADLLSRAPSSSNPPDDNDDIPDVNDNTYEIGVINSNQIDPKQLASCDHPPGVQQENTTNDEFDAVGEQGKDPAINAVKQKLESKTADRNTYSNFMIVEDKVYFISEKNEDVRLRLYVPVQLQEQVLKQFHDDLGHMGIDKVYANLRLKYYWPNMYKNVYAYVSKCTTCKLRNLTAQRAPMQETDESPYPFAKISIDCSGPYPRSLSGNSYIIHFIDMYSRWPECFPVSDTTSETIVELLLEHIIPRFSTPLAILTDNGPQFTSKPFKDTLKELNIHHITTTYYRPQSNAVNERLHRTLHDILSKKVVDSPSGWDIHLAQSLGAIRASINESTGYSAHFLVFGQDPVYPLDNLLKPRQRYLGEDLHQIRLQAQHKAFVEVHRNVKKAKAKQKKYADRLAKPVEIQVGDHVFYMNHRKSSKLDSRWKPNYIVIEQTGPVSFRIKNQLTAVTTKAHASQLHKASTAWEDQLTPTTGRLGKRQSTMVMPEESSSDDENDSEEETEANTPALEQLVRQTRTRRDDSSSEEEIPLAELRTRLRERNRKEIEQASASTGDNSIGMEPPTQTSEQTRTTHEDSSSEEDIPLTELRARLKERKRRRTERMNTSTEDNTTEEETPEEMEQNMVSMTEMMSKDEGKKNEQTIASTSPTATDESKDKMRALLQAMVGILS